MADRNAANDRNADFHIRRRISDVSDERQLRRERETDLRAVQQPRLIAQSRAEWPTQIVTEDHGACIRRDMKHFSGAGRLRRDATGEGDAEKTRGNESSLNPSHKTQEVSVGLR